MENLLVEGLDAGGGDRNVGVMVILVVTSGEFEFVDGLETGVVSGVVGGDIVQGLRHHPVEGKDEHV